MATGQEGSIEGRIPPGQHLTDRFPVLHAGGVQHVDNHDWTLRLSGLVSAERTVTWEQLMYLPAEEIPVSYTHLRAHETVLDLVCRLLLEKKKNTQLPYDKHES